MAKAPSNEFDELAKAIGHALSDWAIVEEALLMLFQHISGIADPERAHAAFSAILSFESRLDVCDALVPLAISDQKMLEIWKKLSDKLSKFYKQRHPLAHFAFVTTYALAKDGTPQRTKRMAPFWPTNPQVVGLSVADINLKAERFRQAAEAVTWFWAHPLMQGRAAISAPRLPSLEAEIQTLIAQNQAAQTNPPRP